MGGPTFRPFSSPYSDDVPTTELEVWHLDADDEDSESYNSPVSPLLFPESGRQRRKRRWVRSWGCPESHCSWGCALPYHHLLTTRGFLRFLRFLAVFISGVLFALFVFPLVDLPVPDSFDQAFHDFQDSFQISPQSPDYPVEFLKSVLPVPCHSHNDYWRQRPLYSALGTGCVSVEADVWLVAGELYVGHSLDELTNERTLRSVYIDPLVAILERMNDHSVTEAGSPPKGVFYQDPTQSLVLVIDFKTSGLWPHVLEQLAPLRERGWLTHWNGKYRAMRPVTIVASGSTPFDLVTQNDTYRDIFYDAPLEALRDPHDPGVSHEMSPLHAEESFDDSGETGSNIATYKYNTSNSYYASTSLTSAIGPLFGFSFTEPQIALIRKQVRRAHERGLVPRYWGTPRWPRGLRDQVWGVLLHEDVGVLNVDDLRAMRKGTWGLWPQLGAQ